MKYSIIIPMYNAEKTIRRCIDSVLAQTYRDFELLVIDDGSTDCGGGIVCNEYMERDDRIRMYSFENGGIAASRNRGLKNAEGDIIVWLDADDSISEHLLERIDACFDRETDAVYFQWQTVDAQNCCLDDEWRQMKLKDGKSRYSGAEILQLLFTGQILNYFWSVAAKKSCYDGLIFPEGRRYEDMAVMYRFLDRLDSAVFLPQKLYFYNIGNPDSITANYLKQDFEDELRILSEMDEYFFGRKEEAYIALYKGLILVTMTGSLAGLKDRTDYRDLKKKLRVEVSSVRGKLRWSYMKQSRYRWKLLLLRLGILGGLYEARNRIRKMTQ